MRTEPKIWPSFIILISVAVLSAVHYMSSYDRTEADIHELEEAPTTSWASTEAVQEPVEDFETVGSFAKDPEALALETSSDPEVRELGSLLQCATQGSCDFPDVSPESYDRELTKSLVRRLRKLANYRPTEETERAGRLLMNYPNDDVKSAALLVLEHAPINEVNLQAILSGLQASVSAPLYNQAIEVLERYKGSPALDRFLVDMVRTGGHFASIELARHSLRFMSAKNAHDFQSVVSELPVRSQARTFLEMNLQEYERLQNGG